MKNSFYLVLFTKDGDFWQFGSMEPSKKNVLRLLELKRHEKKGFKVIGSNNQKLLEGCFLNGGKDIVLSSKGGF